MKYLLGGYYGRRNLGDDVLLYAVIASLHRIDRSASFTVLSPVPLVIPENARVSIVGPGSWPAATLRQIVNNDMWVFGGGGVVQDHTERSLSSLVELVQRARFAKLIGRKLALWGVGIGPIGTTAGKRAAGRLIELADFVSVRDLDSAALASQIDGGRQVSINADLAFLLAPQFRDNLRLVKRESGQRQLGVSLLELSYATQDGASDDRPALAAIASALNGVLDRPGDWRIRCFEFFSGSPEHSDASVFRRLLPLIHFPERVSVCGYSGDFFSTFRAMAQCDAFLGMRLHSAVLAYLADLPLLLINYHPKCRTFAAQIELSAEAQVSADQLTDGGLLAERIHALLDGGQHFRPALPPEAFAGRWQEGPGFESWLRSLL
jgi:polysaccharide pyruvyl transferase CsaB